MDVVFYVALIAGVSVWFAFQAKSRNAAKFKRPRGGPASTVGIAGRVISDPPPATAYVPPSPDEIARHIQDREERFVTSILDKYPGRVERHFFFRLAGTSHRNPDRTSRTAAIARCERGEELWLEHQPDNEYDPNAVAVYSLSVDRQIGYLPARLAGETVRASRKGYSHAVYFAEENLHPETDRVVGATCIYVRLTPLPTDQKRNEENRSNTVEQSPAETA